MSIARTIQALRRTRLFGRLGSDRLNVLAFSGERIEFDRGDLLLGRGDEERACLVVLEGMVEADGGQEISRSPRQCGPGAVFGEYCLLLGRPSTVTVSALSKGAALRVDHALIERMVAEFPDFAVFLRDRMAARMTDLGDRMKALAAALKGQPPARPRSAPAPEHGRKGAPSPAPRR